MFQMPLQSLITHSAGGTWEDGLGSNCTYNSSKWEFAQRNGAIEHNRAHQSNFSNDVAVALHVLGSDGHCSIWSDANDSSHWKADIHPNSTTHFSTILSSDKLTNNNNEADSSAKQSTIVFSDTPVHKISFQSAIVCSFHSANRTA
jgi:hypothetical protein